MKYTDEEIRRNSEEAEALFSQSMPFSKEPDGKYSSDKFGNLGPVQIPCRRVNADIAVLAFDKPDDLIVIADETPNGKRIGTKIIVHKRWEGYVRRSYEIAVQVFKEAGFTIGDPDNDKFIPLETMMRCQAEIQRRVKAEYGDRP